MGLVQPQWRHHAELATAADARMGARLRDCPRAHAPAADGPFRCLLGLGGRRLPELPRGCPVAEGTWIDAAVANVQWYRRCLAMEPAARRENRTRGAYDQSTPVFRR